MGKKTKPTAEFLKDLKAVFDKHNWSGKEIGITSVSAAADEAPQCPPGTKPQLVSFKNASGATETKIICIEVD